MRFCLDLLTLWGGLYAKGDIMYKKEVCYLG